MADIVIDLVISVNIGKKPEDIFTEWNMARLNSGVIEGATALRYRKTCDKYIKNAAINKKSVKRNIVPLLKMKKDFIKEI